MKRIQSWLSPEIAFPSEPGAYEDACYARGFKRIAGLDEVGRGTLAGPVVAAAVVMDRGITHPDIKDSKLLAAKKREFLACWIKERAAAWGVGIVGSQEIDRINILQASLLAMAQALGHLDPTPDYILIDGSHKIPLEFLKAEGGGLEDASFGTSEDRELRMEDGQTISNPRSSLLPLQMALKKGDRLCLSISAASIVAKVERDRIMEEYGQLYPEYGFAQHKGYGCPSHLAALDRHGPSPIHRMSFKPVREWLARAASDQPSVFSLKLETG